AGAGDQQVFFFVDQALTFVLAHFKIRRQLNRGGRARLFAHAAENAARKVDAEKLRIPAAVLFLGFLQRNTTDRAGHRTQVARHATIFAVGIAAQHDAAAITRRQIHFLLGVLNRVALAPRVRKDHPDAAQRTPDTDEDRTELFHHLSFPQSFLNRPATARRRRYPANSTASTAGRISSQRT